VDGESGRAYRSYRVDLKESDGTVEGKPYLKLTVGVVLTIWLQQKWTVHRLD